MMEDEAVFSVFSKCFAPVGKADWELLTRGPTWADFLDETRRLIQDDSLLGSSAAPLVRMRGRCPLQEFLSNGEIGALFAPPTYEEKSTFAARHFTGGLPESAVPVESLYVDWAPASTTDTPFPRARGLYGGDTARYMRHLVESLGLQVPDAFSACPDHVSLELDLVAVLLRSGMRREALRLFIERSTWLTEYRMRLLALRDDARFYIGLVDVLLGIRTQIDAIEPSR